MRSVGTARAFNVPWKIYGLLGVGARIFKEKEHSRLCRNNRVNLGQMCGVRLAAQRADEASTNSMLNKDPKPIPSYFFLCYEVNR